MILTDALLAQLCAVGQIPRERFPLLRHACSSRDAFEFVRLAIQHGLLDKDVAGQVLGEHLQCPYLNLESTLVQPEVVALLSREMAERYQALPVYRFGAAVTVAMTAPTDARKVHALTRLLGQPIEPRLSFPNEVDAAIRVHYQPADAIDRITLSVDFTALTKVRDDRLADLPSLIELSTSLLVLALKERASDIHIEPKHQECLVRFRIDGLLCDRLHLPATLAQPLVSRIKVLANLDIAERRKPQDGRFDFATPLKNMRVFTK